ncbi:unnamed protein product [Effrenium voratum]|nr:unnamed protein product [Effrenium voratum]
MAMERSEEPMGIEKIKVLAYSIPMMGHLTPLLHLSKALAARGHDVLVVSSEFLEVQDKLEAMNVRWRGLKDGEKPVVEDPNGPHFQRYMDLHMSLVSSVLDEEKPDVILADYVGGAAMLCAREKAIPLVVNAALPTTLVARMTTLLRIPLVKRFVTWMQPDVEHPLTFIKEVSVPVCRNTLTIINSCTALDGCGKVPANFFLSGPLDGFETRCLDQSKHSELVAFLEKLGYITTGSLMQLTEEKKDKQSFLPEGPERERFFVSGWMPQAEIMDLKELSMVLTHCGWGGSLERLRCMMAGKPVICYPGFGDQNANAQMLQKLGVGVGSAANADFTSWLCGSGLRREEAKTPRLEPVEESKAEEPRPEEAQKEVIPSGPVREAAPKPVLTPAAPERPKPGAQSGNVRYQLTVPVSVRGEPRITSFKSPVPQRWQTPSAQPQPSAPSTHPAPNPAPVVRMQPKSVLRPSR